MAWEKLITESDVSVINKELSENKTYSVTSGSTDTEYPSAKAVYDLYKIIENSYSFVKEISYYTTSDGNTCHNNNYVSGCTYFNYYDETGGKFRLSGTTVLPPYEVNGTKKLTSIILSDCLTEIGDCAFMACNELSSITLPDSIIKIGNQSFQNCSGLTTVKMSNNVETIGYTAFYGCSALTSINISNQVQTIRYSAFTYCTSLTSIEIPNSVTIIEGWAFRNCWALSSITIPNSVTNISDYAFAQDSGLTYAEIGSGITYIGSYIFYGCSALTSVKISATTPPTITANTFYNCSSLETIYVPSASLSAYKSATNWSIYASRIVGY